MGKTRNHNSSVPSLWELSSYKTVWVYNRWTRSILTSQIMQVRVAGAAQKSMKQVLSDLLLHCTGPTRTSQTWSKQKRWIYEYTQPQEVPGCSSNHILPCKTLSQKWQHVTATIHRQGSRTPQCACALLPLSTPCCPPHRENTVSLPVTCVMSLCSLRVSPSLPPFFKKEK